MVTDREILGVGPEATPEEIRRAFRRLAVKTHPDRGGDPDDFRRIREAYERLAQTPVARRRREAADGFPMPDDFPKPGFTDDEAWLFVFRLAQRTAWPLKLDTFTLYGFTSRYRVLPGEQPVVEVPRAFFYRKVTFEALFPPGYEDIPKRTILLEPDNPLRLTFPPTEFPWVLAVGVRKWERPKPPPPPPAAQTDMFFPTDNVAAAQRAGYIVTGTGGIYGGPTRSTM